MEGAGARGATGHLGVQVLQGACWTAGVGRVLWYQRLVVGLWWTACCQRGDVGMAVTTGRVRVDSTWFIIHHKDNLHANVLKPSGLICTSECRVL